MRLRLVCRCDSTFSTLEEANGHDCWAKGWYPYTSEYRIEEEGEQGMAAGENSNQGVDAQQEAVIHRFVDGSGREVQIPLDDGDVREARVTMTSVTRRQKVATDLVDREGTNSVIVFTHYVVV